MRKMTVSMSHGRVAILHDVRKEISANVDTDLAKNNEIFIDKLRAHNYSVESYTNAKFQPYIDEYNVGKKPSRQIQETYVEHIAKENEKLIKKSEENKIKGIKASVRKPTQLCHEYVLQIGNRESNGTLDSDIEMNREYCREILNQIQEKYPHCDVLLATFHGDEPNGTPHMHITVQFTGEHYERGLSHQISISKALELDGFERSNNRGDYAINRWTNDIQERIMAPELAKLGIEREVLGEHRQHEDIKFFREKAKAEELALQEVREETKTLKEVHQRTQSDLYDLNNALSAAEGKLSFVEHKIAGKEELHHELEKQNSDLQKQAQALQESIKTLEQDKTTLTAEKEQIEGKIKAMEPQSKELEQLELKKAGLTEQINALNEHIKAGRQELQRNRAYREYFSQKEETVNLNREIKHGLGGKTVVNEPPERVAEAFKAYDYLSDRLYDVEHRRDMIRQEGVMQERQRMKPEQDKQKAIDTKRYEDLAKLTNENIRLREIISHFPETEVQRVTELVRNGQAKDMSITKS